MTQREKSKTILKRIFFVTEDAASNEEIRDRLLSGGKVTGTNMIVMMCAIIIASVGLNTDSVAVIIGAMLISPLMGSILAMSYAAVTADIDLMKRHAIGFGFQILVSVGTAVVYFLLSPVKGVTAQLAARTEPTFLMYSLRQRVALPVLSDRQDRIRPTISSQVLPSLRRSCHRSVHAGIPSLPEILVCWAERCTFSRSEERRCRERV